MHPLAPEKGSKGNIHLPFSEGFFPEKPSKKEGFSGKSLCRPTNRC